MVMSSICAVALFAVVFLLVEQDLIDRQQAMLGGAFLFLLLGWAMDFYSIKMAVKAVYFDTLSLIFGMSLISDTLVRSGVFFALAAGMIRFARGNRSLIMLLLILLTYFMSLMVNNLATMVIVLPLTLVLCHSLEIDPVPVAAAELIASNLGGASTLVGDFPNMIIAAAAHPHFSDFIWGMMAPCLILLAALLLFFQSRMEPALPKYADMAAVRASVLVFLEEQSADKCDPYLRKIGVLVMVVALSGFLIADLIGIRPATISFGAGLVILAFGRLPKEGVFKAIGGGDLLFFLGLFIMVGGLQAAGVLEGLHSLIVAIDGGSPIWSLLILMWVAAIITTFFNAGPTTALLSPVAVALSKDLPGSTALWWALSLGVLAGSSASLSGATAGPIVASQIAHYCGSSPLDFRRYSQWGIPMAAIFLGISTLYIVLIGP